MGIVFNSEKRVFKLDSANASYLCGVVDEEGFLGHIYFGKKVPDTDLTYLLRINEPPFVPSQNNRERLSFYDTFPMEYPTAGIGDYRESCLRIRTKSGHEVCHLLYESHEIRQGKEVLPGLPATFGTQEECSTLKITMADKAAGLKVILSYTVFEKLDVIARSVKIVNASDDDITLTRALSVCLELDGTDYDILSLHGSWSRERRIQRHAVRLGTYSTGSVRGESSHQEHPFLAVTSKDATEDMGEVYGLNFVYSGNFTAQVQGTQFDNTRVTMGIHPDHFSWLLTPGQEFQTPEVVMVYSCEGIGGMTRTFHDLYRNHLIRSPYKNKKRPILINNWEATYFDFNTEKLLSIAKEASKLGIEMLVMDDGWFGKRNLDNCALGDWTVNEEKLPGGLKRLVDEVNKLGMKFGIWFEPEMISPDSDLYRAHPDWAIQVPGKTPTMGREQYVLDFSRREILDYVYESVAKVLRSANIEYVKWDMNRSLSDLGSFGLSPERQSEFSHRYVLGLYEIQERLIQEFPNLLLENCSGGGARFDAGMLFYSPQIWCSDNMDAVERLTIQQGTAMVYPLSAMGAHVSDCPNHVVGRNTPFETRGYVALAGTFGYELDVTKISEEDRGLIPEQVAMYHKYNDLVRTGDYYRIAGYGENHLYDAYMVVAKDKKEALVTYIQVLARPNYHSRRIRLKGLSENLNYRIEETGQILSGSTLMNAGIQIENLQGDFKGKLIHVLAE